MRGILKIVLVVSLLLVSGQLVSQGKIDLNGTYKGSSYVEGADIELLLTLVLEHKAGAINGKVADDMGYIDCAITEGKLENNVLTFKGVAQAPEGELPMIFKLTVKDGQLEGSWTAGEYTGEWVAKKETAVKKEEIVKKDAAGKVSLAGTWVGTANLEGTGGPNELTLVLTEKEGKYEGNITGEYGVLDAAPMKNAKLENGIFTFDLDLSTDGGDFTLSFKMTVKGDSMSGSMNVEEMGMEGTWEAKKQ